jgi:cobaltochelatase CobS
VANALGLEFAFTGSLSEEYKVLGFVSPATGQAILTAFLRVWEHGGVFCFDDFDGSDPIAALGLNGPLAGSWCQFPDGRMVKRHIDCVLILTANTWGHGATSEYVGRLKQDAAFLDRFVKLQWEIDEQLELVTSGNETWCKRVQQVRSKVKAQGLKVLVTPRATYYGVALLDAGMTQTQVEHAVLAASMTPDQWKAVR